MEKTIPPRFFSSIQTFSHSFERVVDEKVFCPPTKGRLLVFMFNRPGVAGAVLQSPP